jgi:molybdenum transport protein
MISDTIAAALLDEDACGGDVTTEALGFGARPAVMTFRARDAMTVAGADVARRMLRAAGADTVALGAADGDRLAAGSPLLTARGPAAALHLGWKAAQTLLEILGGIASATTALVEAARAVDPDVAVATTRKSVPGARRLSHLAVKAGGGVLHRQGLGETVLVFAQHRAFLEGLSFADIAARLRRAQPEKAIEIEVDDVAAAIAAAEAGFDVIQMDKFAPAAIAEVARRLPPPLPGRRRPVLAATGGITAATVAAYVEAGARVIVTSSPYTAPPRDVAVTLRPAD